MSVVIREPAHNAQSVLSSYSVLRGSQRATRVFAPAKFPDVENRGKQQHVFASRRFTGAAEPVALDTRVFNSNPARAGEGLDFKAPFHVMERAHKLLPQDAFIKVLKA